MMERTYYIEYIEDGAAFTAFINAPSRYAAKHKFYAEHPRSNIKLCREALPVCVSCGKREIANNSHLCIDCMERSK